MHCGTSRGSPAWAVLQSAGSSACDYWAQGSFKIVQFIFTLEKFLSCSASSMLLATVVLLLCEVCCPF